MIAVHGHGYGWVVVFEPWEVLAPDFAGAEVAIVYFAREVEVESFYVVGEDSCAGAESNVKQLEEN